MTKIYEDVTELIGYAPIVKLKNICPECNANIIAKLEYFNPGGSCKDNIALNMIETAEKQGLINKDTMLIEATSGNTGIALAVVCAVKKYNLTIIMPEDMSDERKKLLKAYGVNLILTPASLGMKGCLDEAEELKNNIQNSYIFHQFKNPANPEIHRIKTAEKIWAATEGKIDFVVAGVGTGGTITGIAQNLKTKKKNFKAIAVEPSGSAVLSGCEQGRHELQGIGVGFIPETYDPSLIDEVFQVDDNQAIETARNLAKKEGILCGMVGGAAVYAALKIAAREENKGKMILAVISDTGERYLSTPLFE